MTEQTDLKELKQLSEVLKLDGYDRTLLSAISEIERLRAAENFNGRTAKEWHALYVRKQIPVLPEDAEPGLDATSTPWLFLPTPNGGVTASLLTLDDGQVEINFDECGNVEAILFKECEIIDRRAIGLRDSL